VTTPEGTFCVVTGIELRGVELKCFDFRQCCTPVWAPKNRKFAARRRSRSMKKCEARSMGLGRMEESVITLFGSTSRTRAAVKTTLRNSSIIAAKKQLTGSPPTMASVMRSIRVIRQRPAISQGADPKSLGGVARALWRLAAAVNLRRDTYASLAAFAMLFASTITSKSAAEIKQLCARVGTTDVSAAIRAPIEHHVIPDTVYGKFGVSCRAMSKMWREIKTSAGSARKPPQ
jgi:hypothetical protein